ncbi:NADP-dependent oxidoreductase [Glycomyces luteolus]|uniref:NADP-dependent oxidoreductase n=1 Tax=Glycomyces luteolus TaxID=2670330 RepID=A0A9X3PBT9_9ACTN|nr:NADP-dependent oxidoreductase [Glycomyces luteolus]MDA1360767.1 NADP-dependent oxidoreductase [Glycomyces luteolus]
MFALTFPEYGPSSVLAVTEVPEPHAGPGQIRIKVRTAAVNPIDWKVRAGYLHELFPVAFPGIPGYDSAGVVDEVGEGVTGVAIGDEVIGYGPTAQAEYTVVGNFTAKPASMSWELAAALPTAAETAVRSLELLGLAEGQTVVIDGAAGSVGSAAAQFAVAKGLKVIGTASEANHDYLRSIGVQPTVYGEGLPERVAALAPEGVHGAIDTAGAGSLPELAAITGDPKQVVTIADFSGSVPEAQVTLHASAYHALAEATALFEAGRFDLRIDSVHELADGAKAQDASQFGHPAGKIILNVAAN